MTEKIKEILAVLDLPEKEQRRKIAVYLNPPPWKHNFVAGFLPEDPERCDKCGKKLETNEDYNAECPYTYDYDGSLADLAIRLRDEIINTSESIWSKAKELTAKKWVDDYIKLVKKVCDMNLSDNYIGLVNAFFVNEAQPIHWIDAAIIAKEIAKDGKI